jgi:hypothetical protein
MYHNNDLKGKPTLSVHLRAWRHIDRAACSEDLLPRTLGPEF